MTRSRRVEENENAGRDFVVGDLHGELDTLEAMLEELEFQPGRDRLFALGGLVDCGSRSADVLAWMEGSRITLSVRGNHKQMLLERIKAAVGREVSWRAHPWFPREVDREEWPRWKAMIDAMPIATTVRTPRGYVGLVHASPTARYWGTTLRKVTAGNKDTIEAALWSSARTRGDRCRAEQDGVPVDGPIHGAHAVMNRHTIVDEVTVTDNVWHIDTGAGFPKGRLTIARIDTDPIESVTMPVPRHEQRDEEGAE